MDSLRAYLLSDKNIHMLEMLIIPKIYKFTGVQLNQDDQFFKQQLMTIIVSVINSEIKLLSRIDNSAVLKINNIIILEAVKHISGLIEKEPEEEFSSKIEDLEVDQEEDFFENLKQDEINRVELKPEFETEILVLDSEVSVLDMKQVVSVELLNCYFDFSDYIITEKNNCFCIDNEERTVEIGNYTPLELVETLNSIVNNSVIFELDLKKDTVVVRQQSSSKKSLTGAIKENQKQVIIDFGVKNSIGYLLGFEHKTYFLKETCIVGYVKHNIKHKSVVKVDVCFDSKVLTYTIPITVAYNETLHYKPIFSKSLNIESLAIDKITINMDCNTRGRPYAFFIKFIKLANNHKQLV